MSDGAQRVKGKSRSLTDSLVLASTAQKTRPFVIRMINQSLVLSDNVSRMRLLVIRGISHNLGLSSAATKSIKLAIKQFKIKIKRYKKLRY